MSVPEGKRLYNKGLRVCYVGMAADAEQGFRVTDRRHREGPDQAGIPPAGPPGGRDDPQERSLVGLFMMLASEALIALGEAPDPSTGELHQELDHASQIIDLLTLLRDKTEGHRSADESSVLERLLHDLQLRFVHALKAQGR
jgi:uncharacterized protein DUF1844